VKVRIKSDVELEKVHMGSDVHDWIINGKIKGEKIKTFPLYFLGHNDNFCLQRFVLTAKALLKYLNNPVLESVEVLFIYLDTEIGIVFSVGLSLFKGPMYKVIFQRKILLIQCAYGIDILIEKDKKR